MTFTDLIQLSIAGVTIGCIYGLVALGYHLIYVSTGVINFATGEQVVIGGLLAVLFATVLKLNLFYTFILVAISAGFIGLVFERLVIRPAMKTSDISVIIATIAVSIIVLNGNVLIWGKEHIPFPAFSGGGPIIAGGVVVDLHSFWILGLTCIFVAALKVFLDHTLSGKIIKACANNMTGAKIVGINTTRAVAGTFVLSAVVTAFAGVIVAPITYAGGTIGTMLGIKGFVAAILGGVSRTVAVVLGGVLLGVLEMFIAGFVSSGYRDAIAILIFMVILVIRPQGIFTLEGTKKD
jgi:branched-chain amino acid transport system permease protein